MQTIRKLKLYHLSVLILVTAISTISVLCLPNIRFDYNFEAFFPNEDEELEVYDNYRKTFEYDNEFVLLALENKTGIFKKDFLLRIDSLSKSLSQLNYVKEVNSPTNLKITDLSGIVPIKRQLLHFENEAFYAEDSVSIYASAFLVGSYFPSNAKSLSLFIKTDDVLTKKQCDDLSKSIETTLSLYKFDAVHLVGRIFAQSVYLETLQKEFTLFLALAFLVVIVFLWFSFKSTYGIIVPVILVLISILWTLGIMSFMGKSLDIMTTMLPTMIFIAGMSDVIHFLSKYFDELQKGTAREKIFTLVLKVVGFPTFLTLLTTVVGFLSLLFSSIQPIRDFGIYTAVGVGIAFILTYTFLPAVVYFFPPRIENTAPRKLRFTSWSFKNIVILVFRYQKLILSGFTLLLLGSIVGLSQIKINNILLEDLSDKVKIKQDFNFFDTNYSGARPLEIELRMKRGNSVWDYPTLAQINKLDEFVLSEYGAGFLLSPATLVKTMYKNSNETTDLNFPKEEDAEEIISFLKKNKKNKDIKRLVSADGKLTRISGKIKDMGSVEANKHNRHLVHFFEMHGDTSLMELKFTGAAHLVDRNNEYMVSNMTKGFIFSISIIGLLTFLLHRSWRMVFVFMIPNTLPILAIAGIMGFAGIELKAATSLVFSIAFGIATDDTIHFISRFKLEINTGKSLIYALKRTMIETGKPIVLTSFILIGGFMSLMVSSFNSTFYFGLLICATVIIALIADLLLLPILLFLIYKVKDPKLD